MAQLSIANDEQGDSFPKPVWNNRTATFKLVKSPIDDTEILQEAVNSGIHVLGILFGITAIPILTALAVKSNHSFSVTGAFVYGITFLMVFTFSTVYHSFQQPTIKRIFEILDHISIYFFIAGTYTPLILGYMHNATGMIMLWLLWGLVLAGTTFKICFGCRYKILSTVVYFLMGWMLLWTGGSFFKAMPTQVIMLILSGGLLYTIGAGFYIWQHRKWSHAIWHLFVLAAAVCHYLAIYKTMML